MSESNQVVVAQQKKQRNITLAGLAAAVTAAMLPTVSQAAEITAIGEGLSGEIEGSKSLILALFGAGAILLGVFAGYRYLKRGANSA